jgi:sodium/bile acid cotransporter 7
MKKMTRLIQQEWFLFAMMVLIVIASFHPDIGKTNGLLQLNLFTGIGIALVFFLHGLGLSFEKLKQGIMSWKIHIVVQVFTFGVFPLIFFLFKQSFGAYVSPGVLLGFCYLCALPSTVSASVALTGVARGNVPAAIFNATISGLIGVVATPFLIALLIGFTGNGMSFESTVLGIAKLLLLPLVLGQLARPVLHKLHQRFKPITNVMDRSVILMLVFSAFSDSVESGVWRNNGIEIIFIIFIGACALFALILFLTTWTSRKLGFSKEDEIATVFCGSKKTLASGVPMAKIIFGAHPALGVIMLPIIAYHQVQLIVCAILANRYAQRENISE